MRQLFFYPSLQDRVLDIIPVKVVIKHLFFCVRRQEIVAIKNTLSNFLKGRHLLSCPSFA